MESSQSSHSNPRVGLVLGGGGVRGAVFHAAALMALEIDLGWDSRTADVVVGTSAGALMGLLTRMDVSGTDLAAMISEVPHHADHVLVANRIVTSPELPDQDWRAFLPSVRPSHLLNGSLKRHLRNPAAALLSLYPTGDVDFLTLLDFITTHTHNTWPAGDLRICSVRSDFTRVVWDASSSVDLDLAVASSCSLPGYAQGVAIDGWTYFDGGLYSPTNADVLGPDDVDIVIILSPMTPNHRLGWRRRGLMSRFAERRLATEVDQLRGRGIEVVVMRSPPEVARASSAIGASINPPEIGELAESFFLVGSRLDRLREVLGPLAQTGRN